MKILIYTGYRTGSKSLGNWLEIELGIPYYHEYYNKDNPNKWERMRRINLNKLNDYIIKISPGDGFDFDEIVNGFDKIILLYREDTLAQAQSMMWAKANELWHNTYVNDKFTYVHYTIDDKFLIDNSEKINVIKCIYDNEVSFLKSKDIGLLISYEELFINKTGIKKLENYLGISAKTIFDVNDKLRNNKEAVVIKRLI
jgi:LPS sulfotransferase NodH